LGIWTLRKNSPDDEIIQSVDRKGFVNLELGENEKKNALEIGRAVNSDRPVKIGV
jgi:hypothetical protein